MDDVALRDSNRWFANIRREFETAVRDFRGRRIVYVEIGCWAGASAEWACQNLLTHPEATGYGIDPYTAETALSRTHPTQQQVDAVCAFAHKRLRKHSDAGKWHWIREPSMLAMRTFHRAIDVLYIDGCHDGHAVVIDFALAWPLLRQGSVVVFDDFKIGMRKPPPHVPAAVGAIGTCWAGRVEFFHFGRQAACRVLRK